MAADETIPALEEIQVLSLSTGNILQYVRAKNVNRGYNQWLKPMINLILEGTVSNADYQCWGRALPPVGSGLPPRVNVPLDAGGKIPYLIEFAESVPLDSSVDWLRKSWLD